MTRTSGKLTPPIITCVVILSVVLFLTMVFFSSSNSSEEYTIIYSSQYGWKINIICEDPVIRMVDNFMSAEEAAELIETYEDLLERSAVLREGSPESTSVIDESRTSSTAFLPAGRNRDLIWNLESRAVLLASKPRSHMEMLQLVRYNPGEHYIQHYDYFAKEGVQSQRTTSVLVYLSDCSEEEGGRTTFSKLGLSVGPRIGTALTWENSIFDGAAVGLDARLLHGGEEPINTTKYAVNIWFRSLPFR